MKNSLDRSRESMKSAEQLLKERTPKATGDTVFALKQGVSLIIKPKFTFVDSKGNKTGIRYGRNLNTIFEDAQHDYDTIRLEHITLEQNTIVRDPNLRDFLLLHPLYGKKFSVVDPVASAESALKKYEVFDEVWDDVRAMNVEQLKSLLLLLTPTTLSALADATLPVLRMSVRVIAEKNPDSVREAIADPTLETLYLYHMASALDVIKYYPRRESIVWVDSGKEICKVPTNKEPSTHLARLMLEDDYLKVRELIEQKLND